MRYRNTTVADKYCSRAKRMLKPGQFSHDLTELRELLSKVASEERSFALELSDADLAAMDALLARHFKALQFDQSEIQEALDDPGGLRKMALKEAAERSEKMKEYREFVREDKAFESMVRGETSEERIEEVRNRGRIDVSAMNVKIGDRPKNLREAMALNAKLDLARKVGKK